MDFFDLRGDDEVDLVGKRLRDAGAGGLQRELQAGLERAVRPLPQALAESARRRLPNRGNLAARVVSTTRVTMTARPGSSGAGVHVEAVGRYNLRGMDAGQVRHPVFGRRSTWVRQRIPTGWFSEPAAEMVPDARQAVEKTLRDVADQTTS